MEINKKISCKKVRELIKKMQKDEVLYPFSVEAFQVHLQVCVDCRTTYNSASSKIKDTLKQGN
ncbi:hypothetical protein K0B03_00430 [Patescibacteria group bacterium]|nr:hypothetical protein [Patescibacteria group bacterium]